MTFFGHEARLPVGHAKLALDTGAQMVVGLSHCTGDGQYQAEIAVHPAAGQHRQQATGQHLLGTGRIDYLGELLTALA